MSDCVLVTGGAGFIGSHTVNLLLQQNKEVIVVDNLSSGHLQGLDINHPQLEFIEADVLNFPLMLELIERCDAVLHLAAIASVQYSIEHLIDSFQVNTQGFLHILEAVRKINRPIRLVYASSAAVYGEVKILPCHDEQTLKGRLLSPYSLQKANNEDYAKLYAHLHGIKSLALRYFNVYGPGQDPRSPYSGVISRLLNRYQQEQELIIFGDGKQSRDFIHVDDIARANYLALQNHFVGAVNIATGAPQTLLDLVNYLELAGHRQTKLHFMTAKSGDIRSSYASVELAKKMLNFSSTISLQEGIRLMLNKEYNAKK